MIDLTSQRHALLALLAAALFGISAPLAKELVGSLAPVALAGLLYLGSGLALGFVYLVRRRQAPQATAPLRLRHVPWLLGAVAFGGVLGPLLLLWGLQHLGAGYASLLLGLEGIFTAVIAAAVFSEAVDRRVWLAALVMLAATGVMAWPQAAGSASAWGLGAVALACLCWAVDNNVTRPISAADPVQLAMLKGLAAGTVNLTLAVYLGQAPREPLAAAGAMAVGALSYGVSLVLFILALRHLGSARTAAHFGTAPFFGAAFAIVLGEPLTGTLAVAIVLMAVATWLVLTERHDHEHRHEALAHEHYHEHDEHHQHEHDFPWDRRRGHAHFHVHEPLTHRHAHLPDLHHRHGHEHSAQP